MLTKQRIAELRKATNQALKLVDSKMPYAELRCTVQPKPAVVAELLDAIETLTAALEVCAGGDLASGEGIYKAEIAREALAKVYGKEGE